MHYINLLSDFYIGENLMPAVKEQVHDLYWNLERGAEHNNNIRDTHLVNTSLEQKENTPRH